jgi:predicted Zn-dependent peptidase
VANVILNRGHSSRINRALIDRKIARRVLSNVIHPGERDPNLFYFEIYPQAPFTVKEAEEALYAELERLKTEPVTEQEMERARAYLETNFVREFADNLDASIKLAYDEAILGSWTDRVEQIVATGGVTAEEIQQVARKYLRKSNRTVAYLVKPEPEETSEDHAEASSPQ